MCSYLHQYRCSSFVGMQGGVQEVSLVKGCNRKGHAMHEIGHALGMWHEHSRPDRRNYVRIIYENIEEEMYHRNFQRLCDRVYEPIGKHKVKYDYQSVMHYGEYAFSSSPGELPTIEVREEIELPACFESDSIGQRKSLSWRDQLRMNKLYQCIGLCVYLNVL